MGREFSHICQLETRKLLWLMGVVFSMIIMFQYFERPYGYVISSLFSDGKDQIPVRDGATPGDISQNANILGNLTDFIGLNSTAKNSVHDIAKTTKISKGTDVTHKIDSISGRNEMQDDEDDEPTIDSITTDNISSLSNNSEENIVPASEENENLVAGPAIPPFALPPIKSAPPNILFNNPNSSLVDKHTPSTLGNYEGLGPLQSDVALPESNSSITNVPRVKEGPANPTNAVVSISQMNDILSRSHSSSHSMKPRWSSAIDQELLTAKSLIEKAPILGNNHGLYAPLYRDVSMFIRSYELMEKTLKVYIYKEGKMPVFHQPVLKGIYASEGWFMKLLKANKQYVTKKPRKAHLFYLPFSSRNLEETLYVPNSHNHKNLIKYLKNYLDQIVVKYPFWNRTGGADHFLAACHDWAPAETREHMAYCIRALCNSDIKEGFKLGKDVSLPETNVRSAQNPLKQLGGQAPSQRPILAFFAGKMHGDLRPALLKYWENKDPDMKIFGQLPKSKNNRIYSQYMKTSKYCICAKGYEVNSPRVVEAIFFECVPVIVSDNFVPPFFEILNWESFAIFVQEKDVTNLKNILIAISEQRYMVMQQRVKQVQQHFLWHTKPVKYDIFHMILHSIWYNRVFQIRPR